MQNTKLFLIGLIFSTAVQAQQNFKDAYDYTEQAKSRSYLGGAEESDLKVLPETYFQKNKKNANDEISEGF